MQKKPIIIIVLALALGGLSYWAYQTYFANRGNVIEASGTIEATTVELSARTAGAIGKLIPQEGDQVKKGDVVAELVRNDLQAQREQAAMAVMKAEAQLNDLQSGARIQEKQQAAASLESAKTNAAKAMADLERKQNLFNEGAASQDELERYKTAAELAKNQLKAAQAQLSLLEAGSRPQTVAAARAEVERAKAVLAASDAMVADLKITAPIDGELIARNYEPGEYVGMGASLGTVADLEHLWIKVYIPTDEMPSVAVGKKARFTVSGSDHVFTGVVDWVSPKGEYTPKTIQTKQERTNVVFAVKIRTGSANGMLKPGMPADVEMDRG
ncbi:MAG: HlyD family secretion protein [Solirubrobacterales bacterium]